MTTAEKIKKYRVGAGLTQSQAAKRAGMSQPAWQQYESGLRSPGVGILTKFAKALKVKPADLL